MSHSKDLFLTASPEERIVGYFQAGGLYKGSTVYVTTERIIVNKGRKGAMSWKLHVFLGVLVALLAPVLPTIAGLVILLAIAIIIVVLLLTKRTYRRKWPTLNDVETGRRQFEARKGQILTMELKKRGKLRGGTVTITALSGEPFSLKVLGGKPYRIAEALLTRFDADRVKMIG